MTTAYTSLLGLALPTTGELQGTWGDTVNNSITSLLDSAVAGTTTLSTDGDVTLSTTTGAANQARQAILLCSGARTAQRTITAPAQSKIYTVINNTTGGYAVKLVGVGPTTGVTIPAGYSGTFAWNGSDFVDVSNYVSGNKYINGNLTVTGNLTLSGGTANGVAYLNGSKVVTTGSALTFDGTNFYIAGSQRLRAASTGSTANGYQLDAGAQQHFWYLADNTTSAFNIGSGAGQWTWSNSGGELMRLTSTGLGIGTSSPSTKLQSAKDAALTSTWDAAQLWLTGATSTAYRLQMGYDTTNNYGVIQSVQGGVAFTNLLLNPLGGNVGIGTSSPSSKLVVAQGSGAYQAIQILASNAGEDAGIRFQGGTGKAFRIQQPAASAGLFFYDETNSATRMTIDSSGNLGLGVTPSAWTYFKPLQAVRSAFAGSAGQTAVGYNWYFDGSYKYYANDYALKYAQNATNGQHTWDIAASGTAGNAITFTQAMTLTAAGRLGLGLTSPSTLFEAYGGAAGTSSELTVGNASTAARFGVDTSNEVTVATGQAVPIKFLTSNTERARIDSSGNVGIGTSSPQAYSGYVTLDVRGSTYGGLIQASDGTVKTTLYSSGSVGYSGTQTNHAYGFVTNGAERMRISSAGLLQINTTGLTGGLVNIAQSAGGIAIALTWENGVYGQYMGYDSTYYMGTYYNAATRETRLVANSNDSNGKITFYTGGTGTPSERARIDSSGILMVGTTSAPTSLARAVFQRSGDCYVYSSSTSTGNDQQAFFMVSAQDGAREAAFGMFRNGSADACAYVNFCPTNGGGSSFVWSDTSGVLRIGTPGSIGTTGGTVIGTQTSDERLKTIDSSFPYGLETVNQLVPIKYTLNNETTPRLGFGAQTTQPVIPEVVYDSGECIDGYDQDPDNMMKQTPKSDRTRLMMDNVQIIPVLVKAIQEQQAIIEKLTSRIAALETK